jgi:hypothetical protein
MVWLKKLLRRLPGGAEKNRETLIRKASLLARIEYQASEIGIFYRLPSMD